MDQTDIHKMKLHDKFYLDPNTTIIRVSGGWVYQFIQQNTHYQTSLINSVFVPFNTEFKPIKYK